MFRLVCLLIGRIIGVDGGIHRKIMLLCKFIGLFGWDMGQYNRKMVRIF